MNRRRFIGRFGASFLAAPLLAAAQHAGKIYRIGVLEVVAAAANTANLDAFRGGLRELGYVEGLNVVIDYRSADGRPERFGDLAKELVRLNVDLIVTRGEQAALAAKRATTTIPIVMASSGDPAVSGIVTSLARPGANISGFHTMAPVEVAGRRLAFLKEIVPGLARVAVLWNPGDIFYSPPVLREIEKVARALGIQLKNFEAQRSWDLERAFEAILLAQVDAFIAVEEYLTITHRAEIVTFAAMSRLPAVYGLREFVDDGGLMAYGTDRRDLFRRSAHYVHKIFNGVRPGSLPVEAPTKFELVINLKTAKTLGLTIPSSLLRRADDLVD